MPGAEATAPSGRRFALQRTLGEGAFGTVYLADMESPGGFRRKVALKLLKPDWDPGSDAARRLRDEARLLGRLHHRHIVRVDDLVRVGERWALIMEYVDGADLERLFEGCRAQVRSVPARTLADIGIAVASALDAAWTTPGDDGEPMRVVHRDIKPSNVRLSSAGEIKVLDFGVARAHFAGRESRTERVRYGSLGYMAPERLLGQDELAAGDIYALGVLLCELITLETFGRAELGMDRQAAQVAAARDAMGARLTDPELPDLIARMLAYSPVDRPTAYDIARELERCRAGLPGEDLATFARTSAAEIAPVDTTDDPIRGRCLDETRSGEVQSVSSVTLVFPFGDGPNAPPLSLPQPEHAPPRSRVPGILVGLAAVLAIGAGLGWGFGRAPEAPTMQPVAAAQAPALPTVQVASAPLAAPEAMVEAAVSAPAPGPTPKAPARSRPVATAAAPAPAIVPVEAASPSVAAADAVRLRAVKFTLTGAEGLDVRCGDVSGTGATSALLRDVPAGDCLVTAAGQRTRAHVEDPRAVACALDGDALTCR